MSCLSRNTVAGMILQLFLIAQCIDMCHNDNYIFCLVQLLGLLR